MTILPAQRARMLARKAVRAGRSLPAVLALYATNLAPVSAFLTRRYNAALARHPKRELPHHESAIVAGIERDGVFVAHLDAIGQPGANHHEIMEAGAELASVLAARVARMANRPTTIAASAAEMLRHPLVFRFGLHPTLLRIAEAYLGQPVAYDGALLFHTAADGQESGTRHWHLDREDRRVLKIALYLHDVPMTGGPFELFQLEKHRADGKFHYRDYMGMTTAKLERKLGAKLLGQNITTCIGRAGTLIFADNARFYHRGRPATGRARAAIFYSYFARTPRHPFFGNRGHLSRKQILTLTEGLSDAQKQSALWRDSLPWPLRAIPVSP